MTTKIKNICALIFGMVFGAGLLLSGMANPAKVIGFLDIFGEWDPSLALVMLGAIGVAIIPFQLAVHHSRTYHDAKFDLPTAAHIDKALIVGAAIFGVGWSLVGICPAPVLSLIGLGKFQVLYFMIPMVLAMLGFDWFKDAKRSRF